MYSLPSYYYRKLYLTVLKCTHVAFSIQITMSLVEVPYKQHHSTLVGKSNCDVFGTDHSEGTPLSTPYFPMSHYFDIFTNLFVKFKLLHLVVGYVAYCFIKSSLYYYFLCVISR